MQPQVHSDPKWLLHTGWNKGNHDNNIHWCALFKQGSKTGSAQISPIMTLKILALTTPMPRLFYTFACCHSNIWFFFFTLEGTCKAHLKAENCIILQFKIMFYFTFSTQFNLVDNLNLHMPVLTFAVIFLLVLCSVNISESCLRSWKPVLEKVTVPKHSNIIWRQKGTFFD